MNPINYRVGISGSEAILPQLCTINEGARFMAAITRNPSVFSQLFSPKGEIVLTPEQHGKLKTMLREQGGGANAGGLLVPNIPLEATKLAWSPEEMALDSVLKMPESHICAALGVSTIALNLTAGERRDTFANKAVARKESYENGVMPLQRLVSRQMRRQLPELFQPNQAAGYSYASTACLQEQRADRAKRLVAACGGPYMSVNEARSEDGLEKLADDFDELRNTPQAEAEEAEQPGRGRQNEEDDDDE
jgi:phage portal protein BeeE